jgi:hypothetical protein
MASRRDRSGNAGRWLTDNVLARPDGSDEARSRPLLAHPLLLVSLSLTRAVPGNTTFVGSTSH